MLNSTQFLGLVIAALIGWVLWERHVKRKNAAKIFWLKEDSYHENNDNLKLKRELIATQSRVACLEAQQKTDASKIRALEATLKQQKEQIESLLKDKVILENGLKVEQTQNKRLIERIDIMIEVVQMANAKYDTLLEWQKKLQNTYNLLINTVKRYPDKKVAEIIMDAFNDRKLEKNYANLHKNKKNITKTEVSIDITAVPCCKHNGGICAYREGGCNFACALCKEAEKKICNHCSLK